MLDRYLIIVRGGGDVATGTISALKKAGFSVLILESDRPSAIRRSVAFCDAIYNGHSQVEGMECFFAKYIDEAKVLLDEDKLTMIVDTTADSIRYFDKGGKYADNYNYIALVDGILAKRNLGTNKDMAPFVVALGPGFTAGIDCDVAIETMRGHNLSRIFYKGSPLADTGIPGLIAGHAADRVIHAPAAGIIHDINKIGDIVKEGEAIAHITTDDGENVPVLATITGLLRGIIHDGYRCSKRLKIADIDPRETEYDNCFTISDKARAIGGSVLIAILEYMNNEYTK